MPELLESELKGVTIDMVEDRLLSEFKQLGRTAREANQWQLAEVIQDAQKKALGIIDAILKTKAAAEARATAAAIQAQRAEMGLDNSEPNEPKRPVGRPPKPTGNGENLYPQT